MQEREFNYEEELSINPDALDVEWLAQPSLFMKYAEAASEARHAMDEAKENVDLVKAEVDREIRQDPGAFGLEKTTEGSISAAVLCHERYQEAIEKYNQSRFQNDLLMNAVRAFDQRKVALENLVKLHGQSYFSGPSEPRNLGMEWDKRVKCSSARSKVKDRLNKGDDDEDDSGKKKPRRRRRTS